MIIKRDDVWYWDIYECINGLIEQAEFLGWWDRNGPNNYLPVMYEFNGVIVSAMPGDNPDELYRRWNAGMEDGYAKSRNRRLLHERTPEGIAELRAEKEEEERRLAIRKAEGYWPDSLRFSFSPHGEEAWESWLNANGCRKAEAFADFWTTYNAHKSGWESKAVTLGEQIMARGSGYGEACCRYAARWAKLMEERLLANGDRFDVATVGQVAKEAQFEADMEGGITGFMFGAAVAMLAVCWKHGEALRRWHNRETQIGDEGDRANETGGVLNPALLSMGAAA